MVVVLLLSLLLQPKPAAPKPAWTGELTLTIKGSGTIDLPRPKKLRVTWNVDRTATGTVVLDRMFKGGGIAGTPNTRDTMRYETWIANSSQPLIMQVKDTGSYFGPTPSGAITLDVVRLTCPSKTAPGAVGQIRSSTLQFDYEKGTYSWEAPRLFTKCDTSNLRTPVSGPADWMSRAPFDLAAGPVELAFEMIHWLNPLNEWMVMKGTFQKGATEVVVSRTLAFTWMHPLVQPAPVTAELTLVLRKTPG